MSEPEVVEKKIPRKRMPSEAKIKVNESMLNIIKESMKAEQATKPKKTVKRPKKPIMAMPSIEENASEMKEKRPRKAPTSVLASTSVATEKKKKVLNPVLAARNAEIKKYREENNCSVKEALIRMKKTK